MKSHRAAVCHLWHGWLPGQSALFKANTFGVPVRFRSHEDWVELFHEAGFRVTKTSIGEGNLLRLFMIRTILWVSFSLEAK